MNIIRVDPYKKYKKIPQRKRSKKRHNKKSTPHTGGCRIGLRSSLASDSFGKQDMKMDFDFNMFQEEAPMEPIEQVKQENSQ